MIQYNLPHGLMGAPASDLNNLKYEAQRLVESIDKEIAQRGDIKTPRYAFTYEGDYYVFDTAIEAFSEAAKVTGDPEAGYRVFLVYR